MSNVLTFLKAVKNLLWTSEFSLDRQCKIPQKCRSLLWSSITTPTYTPASYPFTVAASVSKTQLKFVCLAISRGAISIREVNRQEPKKKLIARLSHIIHNVSYVRKFVQYIGNNVSYVGKYVQYESDLDIYFVPFSTFHSRKIFHGSNNYLGSVNN